MPQEVDVQEVFNKVIKFGLYVADFISGQDGGGWYKSPYMCNALMNACGYCVITEDECAVAKAAIREYLGEVLPTHHSGSPTLEGCLAAYGFAFDFPARMAIYQNWANRPIPEQK